MGNRALGGTIMRPSAGGWRGKAICPGMDPQWFELVGDNIISLTPRNKVAQQVCRRCPVRDECLDEAVELGDRGLIRGAMPMTSVILAQLRKRRGLGYLPVAGVKSERLAA